MLVKSFIENLLLMIGGITVFLFGLKGMSENVQAIAGAKMKGLLASATKNRFRGLAVGTAVTAIIQSSTATNIMLVGFVNVGAIGLGQAIPVILGANIGTTVTAQLVSLSGSNLFDITAFGSLAAFIGFLLTFIKKRNAEQIGNIIFGFGMVFIGLEIMNTAICAFRGYEFFEKLFMAKNPLLLILNGVLITGIVQSSSAVSSVMIILALNGIISFESSMYLILGTNVGAGIAVLLVSSTLSLQARQVALANLLFNVFGIVIFLIPLSFFESEIASIFAMMSGSIERQVANFHTVFNVAVSALLLPIIKPFEMLVVFFSNPKERRKLKTKAIKI